MPGKRKIYARRSKYTAKVSGRGRKKVSRYARIPKMVRFRSKWQKPEISTKFIKFKYIDDGYSGSTTSLIPRNFHCFSGNSLFDPDVTGFGVQPYFFDQYVNASMYRGYIVYAAKITIYPHVVSNFGYQKVIIYPSMLQTEQANNDPSDLMNMRNSRCIVINRESTGGRDKGRRISMYSSTRRQFPHVTSRDMSFQGWHDASPNSANRWYFHVVFDQTHEANYDIESIYDVKIVYYAQLQGSMQNVNES